MKPDCLDGFADIMDAKDGGAAVEGEGVEDGGAVEGFVGTGAEELPYHALTGDAGEDGELIVKEFGLMAEDGIVLVNGLAEAIAGVEDERRQGIFLAEGEGAVLRYGAVEEAAHILDVAVTGHEDIRNAEACHLLEHREEGDIALAAVNVAHWLTDVVDDVGTVLLYRHACHHGAEGIDGEYGIGLLMADDGEGMAQTAHLLFLADVIAAGTGGHCPDVYHGGALLYYLVGAAGNVILRLLARAGIERVGCHVEDAHHLWLTDDMLVALDIYYIIHSFV